MLGTSAVSAQRIEGPTHQRRPEAPLGIWYHSPEIPLTCCTGCRPHLGGTAGEARLLHAFVSGVLAGAVRRG